MSVIVCQNLTKRHGRTVGVRKLCLEVPAGEVFGFLRPNGATGLGTAPRGRLVEGFAQ